MLRGLLMRRQSSQVSALAHPESSSEAALAAIAPTSDAPAQVTGEPVYGSTQQDQGDEVRFSVELTRLDRLDDTYSLDIRRLKGNLRSYKFLYDTLRECVPNILFVYCLTHVARTDALTFNGNLQGCPTNVGDPHMSHAPFTIYHRNSGF